MNALGHDLYELLNRQALRGWDDLPPEVQGFWANMEKEYLDAHKPEFRKEGMEEAAQICDDLFSVLSNHLTRSGVKLAAGSIRAAKDQP